MGQKLMQYKGYGWKKEKYKVVIAQSGKLDVKEKRKYILQQFKIPGVCRGFFPKD